MPEPIKTLSEFSSVVMSAQRELGLGLWWRGHDSAEYKLVPGILRQKQYSIVYERWLYRRFIQLARSRYGECPAVGDKAAWLFLMQHYGLPTRLLDWSEAPFVALFFALELSKPGAAVLYALDPLKMNRLLNGDRVVYDPVSPAVEGLFEAGFTHGDASGHPPAAVVVDQTDSRMLAQHTAFTLHGGVKPLEEYGRADGFLRRVEIAEESRGRIMMELWFHGVRRSTLFPDLANLAKDMQNLVMSEDEESGTAKK